MNAPHLIDCGRLSVSDSLRPPERKSLPPFEALRAFDAVARLGGIRKAAAWLSRDHAVVSRHLRSIESWLGVQLIARTPGGIVLTEQGRVYHESISKALEYIAHATLDVLNSGQHNSLSIWCTPGFALYWLSQHFAAFEARNAGIDFELRPTDASPDFAAHEADLDIRFHATYEDEAKPSAGQRHGTIAHVPIIAVASTRYLESRDAITEPADLLAHELLHESGTNNWVQWLRSYGVACEGRIGGPRLWQGHLTVDAARHGRGIALANSLMIRDDLRSGALIDIGAGKDGFPVRIGHYVLIARRDRWDDRPVRAFRRWLRETIAKELPEFAPPRG